MISCQKPRRRDEPLHRHWDVVVVGAGPAGLAAACATAEAGLSTAVLDANPFPGGQIWRPALGRTAVAAAPWLRRLEAAGAELWCGTRVVDAETPSRLWAESPDGALRADGSHVIVATGAAERLLPFPGWTLPGVYGVGGLQALVKGGLPVAGRHVVVAGSGPLLAAVADDLRRRGAHLLCLAEQASRRQLAALWRPLLRRPGKLLQLAALKARLARVPWHTSTWPSRAVGDGRLEAVRLTRADGSRQTLPADILACGFGLLPETRLAGLLGCRVENGNVVVDDDQRTSVPTVYCAGEPTGIGGVELSLTEGRIAGLAVARRHSEASALRPQRGRRRRFAAALEQAFRLRPELRLLPDDDTVVCRCEDVPWGRLHRAVDGRDAKLHSRCGMGLCQGRICAPALEFLKDWPTPTPRPPLFPTALRMWRSPDPDAAGHRADDAA